MNVLKLSLTAARIPLDELIKLAIKHCCVRMSGLARCTLPMTFTVPQTLFPLHKNGSQEGAEKLVTSACFGGADPNVASALLPNDHPIPLSARRSYLVEHPDLPVDGGPRHPVAVVVKQDSLLFGVASQ